MGNSLDKKLRPVSNLKSPTVEIRCYNCNKLLAKAEDHNFVNIEIKCERCGFLNLITENETDQVIVTDPNGVILYANKQVEVATGYGQEEIIGSRPSLWGKQMPDDFYADLWLKIKDQKRAVAVHLINRHKDGTLHDAILRISPLLDKEGNIKFFVGVTTTKKTSKHSKYS